MDPILALASLSKDAALDAGKGKLFSAIQRFVGTSSDEKMAGAIQALDVERDVVYEVAREVKNAFLEQAQQVTTLSEVETRFFEAEPKDRPSPSDAANLAAEALRQVSRSTNLKKRALLAAALVNSFDPLLYAKGATSEILAILEKLSPPDVKVLEQCAAAAQNLGRNNDINTDLLPCAIKLVELRLARDANARPGNLSQYSNVCATQLGHDVLAHIRGHAAW